jgi:hypothetical protein
MATNKIYVTPGTTITFRASGGDVLWTPTSVATAAGRISDVWDRGSGSKPARYLWRIMTKWAATPTSGDNMRLYLVTSSNSTGADQGDGGVTFGDAAVSNENPYVYDCRFIGCVMTQAASYSVSASGICEIFSRYVAIMGWNSSNAVALSSTADDHIFTFTEIPDDIQAAA